MLLVDSIFDIFKYFARGVFVLLRGSESGVFLLELEFELLILGLAVSVLLLFCGAGLVFVLCKEGLVVFESFCTYDILGLGGFDLGIQPCFAALLYIAKVLRHELESE